MTVWTKAYKFRIYPTKEQKIQLAKTFGCCRFVWNYFLAKCIEDYKETGESNSIYDNQRELTQLKKLEEFSFLKEVDSQALNYELSNLGQAYSNFYKQHNRFPKFKKKSHNQSYNTQNTGGKFRIQGNRIFIPKLGLIKFKQHRNIEGTICYATITKTCSGKYYISLCCKDCNMTLFDSVLDPIGIDLGIHDFAILSDGFKIENPKNLPKALKELSKAQRKLSKKKKGSNNFEKHRIRLAKKHEKVANRRRDFLHKLSAQLVKNHDLIAVEDLSVKELMQDNNFAQYIGDCSWSEFLRQLEYKSNWYGRKFVKVGKYFPSSQLCSCCGFKNEKVKDLRIRKWICPQCNVLHDRDINAAKNILKEAQRMIS